MSNIIKKIIIIGGVLFCFLFLYGCNEKNVKTTESTVVTVNKENKGYDLSIDESKESAVKEEVNDVMNLIKDNSDKVVDKDNEDTLALINKDELANIIVKQEESIFFSDLNTDMVNYEYMESFLNACNKGQEGNIVTYQISDDGVIARKEFIFDGEDMYLLYCSGLLNNDLSYVINEPTYTRIKQWEYTDKGWFCYELCVPEPPEVSEVINENDMIRVIPMKEEYKEVCENYLNNIGYQGNNLFTVEWDENNIDSLNLNGLFASFYRIEYNKELDKEKYYDGIPKEEFEELIGKYLNIFSDEICNVAEFNKETNTYQYTKLGCTNYAPNDFDTSIPEVTDIQANDDGSYTISVDAVCESLGNDRCFTNQLTVRYTDDGGIVFLSNHIIADNLDK